MYWFTDAVQRAEIILPLESWREISTWAAQTFSRQLSRVSSKQEALLDPVAMAMAACLSAKLRSIAKDAKLGSSPELLVHLPSMVELKNSIHILFNPYQSPCGIWPKYFPLFNYDKQAGSNYCFTFEMLEAVLCEFGSDLLLEQKDDPILHGLELATQWCYDNRLDYLVTPGTKYSGWNSGGSLETLEAGEPESWATAVVHMFLSELQEVLTDKVEELILKSFDARPCAKENKKWDQMLDISLQFKQDNTTRTVKEILDTEVLKPIAGNDRKQFRHEPMDKDRRRSALLFGPPGTSKTSLAEAVAKMIGWPLIQIDPSRFLSDGLESIYAKATEVFEYLMDLSAVVILFDEMDALVRTRDEQKTTVDVTSRFLTTSMLPKLAKLHDQGRVVFFMATNYAWLFDSAIKRAGRFDMLLHIGPPSWSVKLARLDAFMEKTHSTTDVDQARQLLKTWLDGDEVHCGELDSFTFQEFKAFLESIRKQTASTTLTQSLKALTKDTFLTNVRHAAKHVSLADPDTKHHYDEEKGTSRLQ